MEENFGLRGAAGKYFKAAGKYFKGDKRRGAKREEAAPGGGHIFYGEMDWGGLGWAGAG